MTTGEHLRQSPRKQIEDEVARKGVEGGERKSDAKGKSLQCLRCKFLEEKFLISFSVLPMKAAQ